MYKHKTYSTKNQTMDMEKAKSLQKYEVKSGIVQLDSEDFTGS
jgi:formylmethanofuran dehydrogenase subunit D